MAKKAPESKAAQAAKIAKGSSKEKKKWTSGKQKDEISRLATVDADLFNKIAKDTANMKIITRTQIVDKYNLNLHAAIRVLRYLAETGNIVLLNKSRRLVFYCGAKFAKKDIVEDFTQKSEVKA